MTQGQRLQSSGICLRGSRHVVYPQVSKEHLRLMDIKTDIPGAKQYHSVRSSEEKLSVTRPEGRMRIEWTAMTWIIQCGRGDLVPMPATETTVGAYPDITG